MTLKSLLTKWNKGVFHGSVRRFAKKIKYSEVTVGEWVRCVKLPGEAVRPLVAKELGVSVPELMAALSAKEEGSAESVVNLEILRRLESIEKRLTAIEDDRKHRTGVSSRSL